MCFHNKMCGMDNNSVSGKTSSALHPTWTAKEAKSKEISKLFFAKSERKVAYITL